MLDLSTGESVSVPTVLGKRNDTFSVESRRLKNLSDRALVGSYVDGVILSTVLVQLITYRCGSRKSSVDIDILRIACDDFCSIPFYLLLIESYMAKS
ncbi:hypothetical protein PoB_002891600 [Plakobranchus ocellatus]|uniref:Uncharacterized protein n=1 Tax=Plakobranchus ocellatus TaxID=259542 RepID=A0AAV3ZTU1_9GAST|nr:hypothetical protein PoB_002891600 [Plakobranchus ocellatus]